MDEHDALQQKVAQIGHRYLKRTLGELTVLGELLAAARGGGQGQVKEIERLAHKICGSGAMFGFDALGERARALELAAAQGGSGPEFVQQLEALAAALDAEVRAAAAERHVE